MENEENVLKEEEQSFVGGNGEMSNGRRKKYTRVKGHTKKIGNKKVRIRAHLRKISKKKRR